MDRIGFFEWSWRCIRDRRHGHSTQTPQHPYSIQDKLDTQILLVVLIQSYIIIWLLLPYKMYKTTQLRTGCSFGTPLLGWTHCSLPDEFSLTFQQLSSTRWLTRLSDHQPHLEQKLQASTLHLQNQCQKKKIWSQLPIPAAQWGHSSFGLRLIKFTCLGSIRSFRRLQSSDVSLEPNDSRTLFQVF